MTIPPSDLWLTVDFDNSRTHTKAFKRPIFTESAFFVGFEQNRMGAIFDALFMSERVTLQTQGQKERANKKA